MKYTIVLTGLLVASLSFAAPAKKASTKVKAKTPVAVETKTTTQAEPNKLEAPAPTAPGTTATSTPTSAVPAASGTTTTSVASVQAPTQSKVTGILEVRPTATFFGKDNFTTENTVGLGYQFNPDFELGAVQYFDTNLFTSGKSSLEPLVQDGFVRAKFNNLYKTDKFTFGYEPRAYLPTAKAARDAGMVTTIRNYLKFAYKASNSVTLTAMELPIIPFYNNAGVGGKANPAFENRVYLIADFDLGAGFTLSLPLYFHQTKARTLVGAANSGQWSFFVYTWPELTFAATENVTLGVAYRSENLMTSKFNGFTLGDGLEQGAFQAIMAVSL
jgi:hypothetical protein